MKDAPPADFAAAINCHQKGGLEEAALLYRKVMVHGAPIEKRAAAANLGQIEVAAGRFADAAALFRTALTLDPSQHHLWRSLGAALLQAGDASGAIENLWKFLSLQPGDPEALYNLALAMAALGQTEKSRATLIQALARQPNFPQARNNLGVLDFSAGEPERALQNFDAALALDQNFADAWFNRGIALRALGQHAQSAAAFARTAQLRPDYAAAHANHGRALHDLNRLAEAERSYARALELEPSLGEARVNRASLLAETGHLAQAIADYEIAHRAAPQDCDTLAALLYARLQACSWDGFAPLQDTLLAGVVAGGVAPPFVLAALGAPGALQTRNAGRWADQVAPQRRPRPPRRPIQGRIRLGYLSGDFHDHATAHLMAELFERHDRKDFAVHGYSYGPDDQSPMRRRLSVAFDTFTDMAAWPHEKAAQHIAADGIDILIDLKGYTAHARPQIPALRPAAIQVNWLGFPGSMGVNFIDYVIADAILAPLSMQAECVEKIVHLPDCFQPNDAHRKIGPATSRAAHNLPENAFVFCCFNNSYKLTPDWLALWMRLLKAVPGSVLWLLDANTLARENLARSAQQACIDPARLIFAPRQGSAAHLARHALADLFLDTLPVNALTTASDALYAGLPVLTVLGDTVAGRGCASILHAMDLDDLVMQDIVAYESAAMQLAQNPDKLAALRIRIEQARRTAPLFDTARFLNNLENCYRAMLAG